MKQLLIATALTLTLAAIPAIASSTFPVGKSLTASVNPDDRYNWQSPCPGENGEVVVSNLAKDDIEVLVKVDTYNAVSTAGTVTGGDSAIVECNGYNNTVKPGNFFLCKTKRSVEIEDVGGSHGAKGYFTVEY